jgi:cyclophilin family peptidyl-prolyl cis-trans isomerase
MLNGVRRFKLWKQAMSCAVFVVLSLMMSCSSSQTRDFDTNENETANANVTTGVTPQADTEAAVIETDYGRIVIELYPNIAPQAVARFKQLVREGVYNGVAFHRIDPSLGIIQTGDPLSRDNDPMNDGTGGSDYPDVPAEFSDVPYARGVVGAARSQSPDSANSQFFITLKRQPGFDRQYTIFGRVIGDMGAANVISTAPVAEESSRPVEPIRITRITLEPRANFQ